MVHEKFKTSHEKVMVQWADDIIEDIQILKLTFQHPGETISGYEKKEFALRLAEVKSQLSDWSAVSLKNIKSVEEKQNG